MPSPIPSLLCPGLLIYLGGHFFLKGNREAVDFGEKGDCGSEIRGGRGDCDHKALNETRLYKKKKMNSIKLSNLSL